MSERGEILVVDDDRAMVRTLSDVLRLKGWSTSTAHSGEEAVAAVRERHFDVVLMDIRMSGITGVDALKEIRAERPGIRVILMTAYSASELVDEAIEAGVLTVLAKPVALPELLELVASASQPRPVLVVDDDPDFLRGLCAALQGQGIVTYAARGLDEAVGLLEDVTVRVVLLDLRLNGFNGLNGAGPDGTQSVAAIREARPGVLVVLFSGYPDALRRTEADLPEGWVVGSLTKPFDPADLIALLERLDVS